MDPYRGESLRVEPRSLVAEVEPPPRGVRVRAWSDGTTRLRLAPGAPAWQRFGLIAAALTVALGGTNLPDPWCRIGILVPIIAAYCIWRASRQFGAERIDVTPAAVLLRRRFGRSRVVPLADVSTVVVSGRGDDVRLDLECRRERVPIAGGLGYDDERLRWIALRLRRAVVAAR